MTATGSPRCHSLTAIAEAGAALAAELRRQGAMDRPEVEAVASLLRPYLQEKTSSEETRPAA
jgi:hypothetical protein